MRIRIALTAAIAAIALSGTAMAAASLNDVVQKGAMADRIKEKNQINLATAKALGDHCVAEAASKNMGVSVVIVDQFGIITYYVRADGQGKANTETALMKAKTVLNTRAPSKAQMNAVRSGNTSEARVISFGNFANAGALPIVVDGQFLGDLPNGREKLPCVQSSAGDLRADLIDQLPVDRHAGGGRDVNGNVRPHVY